MFPSRADRAGKRYPDPSGSVKYISRLGNLDLGARFLVGTWPLSAEKPLPALSLEILGGPRWNAINQYIRINLSAIKIATSPSTSADFLWWANIKRSRTVL